MILLLQTITRAKP